MRSSWRQIADTALATLTPEELQDSAVYLEPRLFEAGALIRVGRQAIEVMAASVMVFVDLAPAANWGHPCRYLLIDSSCGEVRMIEAQFPPEREALRLVHRGPAVEKWMLLSEEPIEEPS